MSAFPETPDSSKAVDVRLLLAFLGVDQQRRVAFLRVVAPLVVLKMSLTVVVIVLASLSELARLEDLFLFESLFSVLKNWELMHS